MNNELKIIFILLLITCLFVPNSYCGEDKELYYKGVKQARHGKTDEAFTYFHIVLNNFDQSSRFNENSLFSVGEYYFSIGAQYETESTFRKVANEYPESITGLLALGYLFNLANKKADKKQLECLKKEIEGFKQVSLLFRDSEEFSYLSAMQKEYKVVYFIDKVEIYIDGELFQEVPF